MLPKINTYTTNSLNNSLYTQSSLHLSKKINKFTFYLLHVYHIVRCYCLFTVYTHSCSTATCCLVMVVNC